MLFSCAAFHGASFVNCSIPRCRVGEASRFAPVYRRAKRAASPTITAFRVRRYAHAPIRRHCPLVVVAPPRCGICGLFLRKFRLSRPSERRFSGTTRRATDDERSFKLQRFRGVTRFLEAFQHRLHGPLAHLVVRSIDRCQRRIVPLGDGNVVVSDPCVKQVRLSD
jgi:hypothetical protein